MTIWDDPNLLSQTTWSSNRTAVPAFLSFKNLFWRFQDDAASFDLVKSERLCAEIFVLWRSSKKPSQVYLTIVLTRWSCPPISSSKAPSIERFTIGPMNEMQISHASYWNSYWNSHRDVTVDESCCVPRYASHLIGSNWIKKLDFVSAPFRSLGLEAVQSIFAGICLHYMPALYAW